MRLLSKTATEDPIRPQPNTDNEEATRANPRSDIADPKDELCKTDTDDANLAQPSTDNVDPNRDIVLRAMELPRHW
jgi:hypothetical protein